MPLTNHITMGQRFLKSMNSGVGQLVWKSLVLIAGTFIAIMAWQGTNMANEFIAKSPSVTAAVEAAKLANETIGAVKSTADKASDKADQSAVIQAKIFDAIKAVHEDVQQIKITAATTGATVSAQITALGKQVDRIEAKQDAAK